MVTRSQSRSGCGSPRRSASYRRAPAPTRGRLLGGVGQAVLTFEFATNRGDPAVVVAGRHAGAVEAVLADGQVDVVAVVAGGLPHALIGAEAGHELLGDLPPFAIAEYPICGRVGQRDPIHPPIPRVVLVGVDEPLHALRPHPPVPARHVAGHLARIDMLIGAARPVIVGQRPRRRAAVGDLRDHRYRRALGSPP